MNLIHPTTKELFDLNKNTNKFEGVHDMYFEDGNDLNSIQSEFYNEVQFPNYNNIEDFGSLLEKMSKNYFIKQLDKEIGIGKTILEAGCGTGQLSRFNRNIFGIDISKGSLIVAKKFIKKNDIKNVNLFRMNIFNLLFEDNSFDCVISNGVLHHTHSPELAFKKLVRVTKPGGLIVIGLYHKYGRLFQKIKQSLYPILGNNLKLLDSRFKKNISEKKKDAWFLDQYRNPHETTHDYEEVLNWFKDENVEFLSSLPFDYDEKSDLFEKKKKRNGMSLFFKELELAITSNQIYEGGFFVMAGRKKRDQ